MHFLLAIRFSCGYFGATGSTEENIRFYFNRRSGLVCPSFNSRTRVMLSVFLLLSGV